MKFSLVVLVCALAAWSAVDAKKNNAAPAAPAPKPNVEAAPTTAATPVPDAADADEESDEAKSARTVADQISHHTYPVDSQGISKVAQAKAAANELKAKAIIQRENLKFNLQKQRRDHDRAAQNEKNLLLNDNRAAFERRQDELHELLDEHKAGIIAHREAQRQHRESLKQLRKLIKENDRQFRETQKFLSNKGANLAKVQERIQKHQQLQAEAAVATN